MRKRTVLAPVLVFFASVALHAQVGNEGIYNDVGESTDAGTRTAPFTSPPETRAGFNPAAGGTSETLWPFGGVRPKPLNDVLMSVVSTDANDNSAGTGARTVRIVCLDLNYERFEETLTLNGLTPVLMVGACKRVHFARVASVDPEGPGSNAGDLLIQNSGVTYEAIAAGLNITRTLAITVPAGRVGYVSLIQVSVDVTQTMFASFVRDSPDGIRTSVMHHVDTVFVSRLGFCLDSATDFEVQGSKSGGVDAGVRGEFKMILVDSVSGLCP